MAVKGIKMTRETPDASPSFDLVLRGGTVIDPANNLHARLDVGITAGKIAQVAPDLPVNSDTQVIDAAGLYVTPGILDIHTHVYPFRPSKDSYVESVNPDAHLFASGVTTTVDAGTAGWEHFLDFKESKLDRSRVRVLAFLNIARSGMVDTGSEQRVADMDPHIAASLARAFPELIVGIKSAHYWTRLPWDEEHPAWASVERAVEAGELCGLPVMVDFWPRPPERPYPDLLLKKLRPGDIHTHVFAQQFPILGEDGKVNPFLFEARKKGVIFDLGHGAGSFWFRQAEPAYQGGFYPDTISTDLHMGNISGPVISMQNTMSKLLNIGMPLGEVIFRSTQRPAQVIGRPQLGTLTPGADADVAVFDLLEGSFAFTDCGKARMAARHKLDCRLTLRAGQVVFDPSGLSMPDWEHAPEAYWVTPKLQGKNF
jgi:dihydroorotase